MENKKELIPCGYARSGFLRIAAVCLLLLTGFLVWKSHQYAPDNKTEMYLIGGIGAFAALLAFAGDLSKNREINRRIRLRKRMLSMPSTQGCIESVSKRYFLNGEEIDRRAAELTQMNKKHLKVRSALNVAFYDPVNNMDRHIRSEEYAGDLEALRSDDLVDVHYSPDGQYWVEP